MQFTDQNTAIIISCRYSSKRLPGKAMLKFGDRTAIGLLSRRLKKSKKFKKIILATSTNPEDDVLEHEAKNQGLHIFRGELNNVLFRNMMAAIKYKVDYIIRVTGDCPFICGEFIDKCIDQIKEYKNEIFTTKGNFPQGIDIELFPRILLEKLNKKENLPDRYKEHMLSYFYENSQEISIKYFNNSYGGKLDAIYTMDCLEDYERLKSIYHIFDNPDFTISEILSV